MNKRSSKTCYTTPDFPKKAYLNFLFRLDEGGANKIITVPKMTATPEEAGAFTELIMTKAEVPQDTIPEDSMLLELSFHSYVPLIPEYWVEPSSEHIHNDVQGTFLNVALKPENYFILVTPRDVLPKKQALFEPVLPLINPNDTKTIENFMRNSDQIVDERANAAAIYATEKMLGFNWKTREVREVKRDKYSGVN